MALNNLGDVPASVTIPLFWSSHDAATGANETLSGLAATDIEVYKGTSMTQRSSDNGYALIDTDGIDVDSMTGVNGISIDLSDNSDAGFYAAGSFYNVFINAVTIDTQTVIIHLASFRIVAAEGISGTPKSDVAAWLGTAASTPTVAGVPNVNAKTWNDLTTVALPLVPTTAGRTLDVAAGGEAGVDFSNINGTLDAAEIGADAITAAKIADGAIDAATFAAGAITAAAIAADAIGASELAADAVTEIAAPILAVLGALNDAAADGDPTTTDTMVAYLKQIINTLEGSAGLPTWPAAAAPANAVSIAEAVRSIYTQIGVAGAGLTAADDAVIALLGAAAGASHAADIAAIKAETAEIDAIVDLLPDAGALTTIQSDLDNLQTRVPAALVGGRMDSSVGAMANNVVTAAAIATDAIGSDEIAATAVTEIQSGLSTLDAAGIRTAVGLASANLDTQLSTIDDFLDTEVAAIKAKTDNLPSDPADQSAVEAAITAAWTTAMTEAYAADGATATPVQALYMILAFLAERSVSGTTVTVKKLDGATTAMTFTINSATTPTSITRAT